MGIALMVRADLGLAPWDVLHQGVAERTGIAIGIVTILTGVVVLLLWIPIRERPGLGTVLNVLVIGLVVDVTLAVVDAPEAMWQRIALLVVGDLRVRPGQRALHRRRARPRPRDGLMTGLARRGHSVRVVRTGIELAVARHRRPPRRPVGVGTVAFAADRRPQRPLAPRPHDAAGARPRTARSTSPPATSKRSSRAPGRAAAALARRGGRQAAAPTGGDTTAAGPCPQRVRGDPAPPVARRRGEPSASAARRPRADVERVRQRGRRRPAEDRTQYR